MGIFNQFSYPVAIVVIGVLLLFGVTRIPQLNLIHYVIVMGVYVLVAVFIGSKFQYPDSPVVIETADDVDATLNNGKSTFVMLYSNY